jgi:hypothetical protein
MGSDIIETWTIQVTHILYSYMLAFNILYKINKQSDEACQVGEKCWDLFWWTHGSARCWSWAPGSTTRRAAHDDNRLWVPSKPQELSDHVSSDDQATSYNKFDRRFNATTDQDSIDYPTIRVSPMWNPNNEVRRINMFGRSNQEVIYFSNKYPEFNRPTTIKCGFSSSSRTPLQHRLQNGPTAGPNLRDKSGIPLPNQCALSDRQATHHHLRKNIFKTNHQGTASPNRATRHFRPPHVWVFNPEL